MDESWYDDDLDPDFDEELRQRLATPGRPHGAGTDGPEQVLGALRPRLLRARRVRRAQVAAAIVAPSVLLVGGLVALGNLTRSEDGQSTIAGQPDAVSTSVAEDRADRVTVEVTETTEPAPPPTGDQVATSDGEAGSTTEPTDADFADGTEPTPDESTTTTTPPTSTSSTAPMATTTGLGSSTSVPGSELVQSGCGSIVVVVVQSSVELIETRPDDGYRVDVKKEGPEVEVSFEGERGHCELNAEYERGRLVTSVDDEPRN